MSEALHVIGPASVDPRSCQMLWVSVLVECVNVALGHGYCDRDFALSQAEASAWLHTSDFDAVCDLAGVDPRFVAVHIEALRAAGTPFRLEVWG